MASAGSGKYVVRDSLKQPGGNGPVVLSKVIAETSVGGVIGDPYLASKEKGIRLIRLMTEGLADFFEYFAGIQVGEGLEAFVRSTNGEGREEPARTHR